MLEFDIKVMYTYNKLIYLKLINKLINKKLPYIGNAPGNQFRVAKNIAL